MSVAYPSLLLVVLDGWGNAPAWGGNTLSVATTPTADFLAHQPTALLEASGPGVGQLPGELGNSEVGHLNLGAGRVVLQQATLITQAIQDQSFARNPILSELSVQAYRDNRTVHLIGLFSRATVHSSRAHLLALLELLAQHRVRDIRLHLITDGRDSDPRDALQQILTLESDLKEYPQVRIQTLIGRYYAMDRDKRWERTEQAFRLYTEGKGTVVSNARLAVTQSYSMNVTDEFIPAHVITGEQDQPFSGISQDDVVLFWNFRPDRMRQIARAFGTVSFGDFSRHHFPVARQIISLAPYGAEQPLEGIEVAFPLPKIARGLAESISQQGWRQYHIAETEKYAHVTYFLNGGQEQPFPLEDRQLVPSPKVATYDLKPEMSAELVTKELERALRSKNYRFLVANYANADMVGHTGNFRATVSAVETIDAQLGRLVAIAKELNIPMVVTADHGNAEQMVNPATGEPATEHTTNLVPCHFVVPSPVELVRQRGILGDVAPSILQLLGLTPPPEMTAQSLLKE